MRHVPASSQIAVVPLVQAANARPRPTAATAVETSSADEPLIVIVGSAYHWPWGTNDIGTVASTQPPLGAG